MRNDLAGPLDQHDEDVQGTAAKLKRFVCFLKQPFGRKQAKWAK
ncbi:hypothetical protein [Bradyrhizobium japonicum]|nr:hypothetical protein [Bradyrhizobium japonicum]